MSETEYSGGIERCDRYNDGTIDDVCGEGQWHLEDMGETFSFIVGNHTDGVEMFTVHAKNGSVVVERDE